MRHKLHGLRNHYGLIKCPPSSFHSINLDLHGTNFAWDWLLKQSIAYTFHLLISSSILPRYSSTTHRLTACKKACIRHKYKENTPFFVRNKHAYKMIIRYKNIEKLFELGIRGDKGNWKKLWKEESSHFQSGESRLAVSQEREVPFKGSVILDSAVMESLN